MSTPNVGARPARSLVDRFATPLTTGLFLVSTVSGVALFFHWASGAFHSMHEWLSMVLLVPVGLHIWKNWRGILGYVRSRALFAPLAVSILVALPFAYNGLAAGGPGGNPAFRVVALMTQARVADLAPALKSTPYALLAELRRQGFRADSADQTLAAVAQASGRAPSDPLFALTRQTPPAH